MGIIVVLDQFIAVAENCYSLRCNFLFYSTEDISIAGIVMAAGSVRVAVAVSSAGFIHAAGFDPYAGSVRIRDIGHPFGVVTNFSGGS